MDEIAEHRLSSEDAQELPLDFHRIPHAASRRGIHPFDLNVEINADWGAPARALLGAAFGILLARWTDQSFVSFDSALAGISGQAPGVRLRLCTPPHATLKSVVSQIVSQVATSGDGGTNGASSRARFTWRADPNEPATAAVDPLEKTGGSATHPSEPDLHLIVCPTDGGFRATFAYDATLFKATTIARFAGHLQVLLAGALARPDASISELPLLLPSEERWLTEEFTGRATVPEDELLHERIEAHAAQTPDAVAVQFRDRTLSYGELNHSANQLARHLFATDVGAECAVVVCVEPGFGILIALLGILKAGAIYVPLDPNYPVARLKDVIDTTQPRLIVTERRLLGKLPPTATPTLCVDDLESPLAELSGKNLDLALSPEQTASVYFTSGTTGKPKGVMASQANLASYARLARERYAIDGQDVVPAIARFSFSISIFELATPLSAGGTVVVLEREHVLDLALLTRTLSEVTLFHAGPSLLKNLLSYIEEHYPDYEAFSKVRHASSGGDMISPATLEGMKKIFFNADVFVIYGCSEISCMGCTYPVRRDGVVDRTFVGRPFDDVVVRVVDRSFNLLPVGVVGEVLFAGRGVVKGYLGLPDLTAEKFVLLGGRRFYRTGDLGRISEAGWLELVGRGDFQVKVRGMRVELAEVEHHLRLSPGVRDGLVVAKEAKGERILVAYVVPNGQGNQLGLPGRVTRKEGIRRYMADHLPDYMVPAVYMELERLPLNDNMKVDRRALPDPAEEDLVSPRSNGRKPETPSERILASLFRTLLGVDGVSLDDNFFELGGQSLLASAFVLKVEHELHVTLSGMDVLRESLEILARICDERLGRPCRRSASPDTSNGTVHERSLFHFGPDQSLFGVLYGSRGLPGGEAVLICAPPGQEHTRAHFVLGRLGQKLAAEGVPVLKFHYYGCGDSLGSSRDVTVERWQRDIAEAYAELERCTQAARITVVGVRLSGTLLWNTMDRLDVERIVLWDPICHGSEYLAEAASNHRRYLRAAEHVSWQLPWRRPAGTTELLGATYTDRMLHELGQLRIAPLERERKARVEWLATSTAARQISYVEMLRSRGHEARLETLDVDCHWDDVAYLEDILPDEGIGRLLASMATRPR